MHKKLLFPFFVLCLALMMPVQSSASSFPDVPDDSAPHNAVEYLKTKGVISGYPDGTFQPEKTINRAEALKMVLLASGTSLESDQILVFSDVTSSDWFYNYVRAAVQKNIVEGYKDGTFKPANNINVAESLKIILVSFGSDVGAAPETAPYPDVDPAAWYTAYAEFAKTKQLIWPLDDGKLHGERDITRGEFAQIIYRMMYMQENNLTAFPLSTDWPTFIHPTDEYSVKYPFGWQKITAGNQLILWKQDDADGQLSWARIFPNSATVIIAVDANESGTLLDDYLGRLQYDSSATLQKMTLNNYPFASLTIQTQGLVDYFFYMPNKNIVVAYTQIGDGLNRYYLSEEVRNIIGTIRYHEGAAPAGSSIDTARETFLSNVRKNILVAARGQETLDLFTDELLIDTDSIGIGTGPVDYYYSAQYDVTIKLERNSDTVLAISDGQTTAF